MMMMMDLEEWFVGILNEELDKFNDFFVDKEEDFVIRLQELKERIERVRVKKNENFTSEREFSEEMLEIRKAFVTIHGEMVLLKNYSSLNFAGKPLSRLVRECETNLELLFPLEAEVIESGAATARDKCDDDSNTPEASAQEDTGDVYKSTLAAMKAIQGLRKASSTYNPLSLAQFFHNQDDDDDDSGAVTAENSVANSPSTLQQNKGTDQENVHSGDQDPASE
ncbi:uncharacterized protein A4U43_C02F22930 [Asparagus officinalis]|uniref:SPX domain-containing protein n=2 Tax=Asparagus officinalis TaxID=4686 RepID=A0A5P1FKC9_ASPOF|nr:uncharacterized protein A4U43_C02F22930 [Asparagus officinalis]